MGALSDLRRHKRVQDFAVTAGRHGGSFETSCSAEQILAWLKESGGIQVTEQTPASLSATPVNKNGQLATDVMNVRVLPGNTLPARVVIEVQRTIKPGTDRLSANNPMTIPPILGLLLKVSRADPDWQPV
jgi:hypothetical protein